MDNKKILIIEDEKQIARFLELELSHEGYAVDIAYDGRIGLEKASEAETSNSASQASSQGETSGSVSQASSQEGTSSTVSQTSPLGDLSSFRKIEEDTLSFVNAGKLSDAKSRVDDLEYTWVNAQAHLKPMNQTKWTEIDNTIDKVLRELSAVHQDAAVCKSALEASLAALK